MTNLNKAHDAKPDCQTGAQEGKTSTNKFK